MTEGVGSPPLDEQVMQRVDWWGRAALKLHAALLVGLAGSAAATWIEWMRALSGHEIAWAYSFEWPLFAVLGTYVWWQLLHEDTRPRRGHARQTPASAPEDDPDLAAWEAYLRRLHSVDPPGGPPSLSEGGRSSVQARQQRVDGDGR